MTILATVERPCAIRQRIAAGNDFNAGAPKDGGGFLSPTFEDDTFKFAEGVEGGLFDPSSALYAFRRPDALQVIGIEIKFGGQANWKLEKANIDGDLVIVYSGTVETELVKGMNSPELPLILLWGDVLKLTTTGASTAMHAYIKLAPYQA
jgi:hypothetical protein